MAGGHAEFKHTCQIAGRTAVVTGSTSGVGKAIAMQLAAAGADVLIHGGHRRAEAEAVSKSIKRGGGKSTVIMADLADPRQVEQLASQAWNWRGGIHIWVNNAGADVLTGPAANWTFEQKLDHLWTVDVRAAIQLSRCIGARMLDAASGDQAILNIGWDQAELGMAGDSGEMFSAIKGAMMAFTKSLAKSLAPAVRVNCLAPGWIKTAWGEAASGYWQERACDESLLGRWGTPQDVAQTALFLLSPAAGFITGQVVAVNGGFRGSG